MANGTLTPNIGFETTDDTIIYPCQMLDYDNDVYHSDQTGNIAYLGTNLLEPFNNNPALTTYTITLINGKTITINKRDIGGGQFGFDFIFQDGYYVYGSNTLNFTYNGRYYMYLVAYPTTGDIDEIEHWNLLGRNDNLNYYLFADINNEPYNLKITFSGSEAQPEDESITLPGGGYPDIDIASNEIGFPPLPQRNFIDTHMIMIYNPSTSDLQSLNSFLWTSSAFENIPKLQNDPMEALISLHILPVSVPAENKIAHNIVIAGVDSNVSSYYINKQYYAKNFGKVIVNTYMDTYYDYAPYTRADIYLPFIGMRQLDINEIMGSTLELEYHIDVLTGTCSAMLKVTRDIRPQVKNENLNSVLYHWNGSMISQGVLSSQNYTQMIKSTIDSIKNTISSAAMGAVSEGALGAAAGAATGIIGGALNAVTTPTPVEHCGNISTVPGMLSVQTPYLVLSRPQPTFPYSGRHDIGLQSYVTVKIGNMKGFSKFIEVHLDSLSCTDVEKAEIESLLKKGIII